MLYVISKRTISANLEYFSTFAYPLSHVILLVDCWINDSSQSDEWYYQYEQQEFRVVRRTQLG
jgi:hypothetical protein